MSELLLIVRLAGQRVALPASDVESVVEIETLTPVPRAASHVAGLAALRSRVLTVIDGRVSLGMEQAGDLSEAVVVVSDGHPYALLVEGVEDVIEASSEVQPLRTGLRGGWARVARGLVEAEGDLLLFADLHALIGGHSAQAA